MNAERGVGVGVCVLALYAGAAAAAPVSEPIHKTSFSIDQPLEVPGMLLNPGSYVLRLIEQEPQRNVLQVFEAVQVWSSDETRLLSTMLTTPNYDPRATERIVFSYFDRGRQQPRALRLWFAPGRNYSQEFVYPRAQAVELAKAAGRGVLSLPSELPAELGRAARMVAEPVSKSKKAVLVAANRATMRRLPKTASYLPLLALVGILASATGVLLRTLA